MAQEQRVVGNGLYGQLGGAITAAQTSITDTSFAALPVITSPTQHMPLSLTDSTAKLLEIVWVTAHTSGSNTVTVLRAQEGTTARAWALGTPWTQAETARDLVLPATSGAQPSNPWIGMRWFDSDTGEVKSQSSASGVVATLGTARPAHIGPNRAGGFPTAGSVITVRSGLVQVTTDASGDATVNYRVAFPNGTIAVVGNSADFTTFGGTVNPSSDSASSFTFRAIVFNSSGAVAFSSATFKIQYVAIGW